MTYERPPTHFVVVDEADCGYCHGAFVDTNNDANEPVLVDRVQDEAGGTFKYREELPWHHSCVAEANARQAVQPPTEEPS